MRHTLFIITLLVLSCCPVAYGQNIPLEELSQLANRVEDYWAKHYRIPPTAEDLARLDALKAALPAEATTKTLSPTLDWNEPGVESRYGLNIKWGNSPGFTPERIQQLRNYYTNNDARLRYEASVFALYGMNNVTSATQPLVAGYYPSQQVIQYLGPQNLSKELRLRGVFAIAEGKPTEAVECFERTIRIGTRMCRGASLTEQLVGIAIQNIGLSGYQTLVWYDAPAESLEAALKSLNRLEKDILLSRETLQDSIQFERVSGLYRFLQNPDTGKRVYGLQKKTSMLSFLGLGTDSAASIMACDGLSPSMRNYFKNNFCNAQALSLRQLQWTFFPAFEKHIDILSRENPELFDTRMMSREEMQKLPPMFRLLFFNSIMEMRTRVDVVRETCQQTRVALAARLFSLRNGRDPKSVDELVPEFIAAVPECDFSATSSSMQLRAVTDQAVYANQMAQRVFGGSVQIGAITEGSILLSIPVGSDNPERIVAGLRGLSALVKDVVWTPWKEKEGRGGDLSGRVQPVEQFQVTLKPDVKPLAVVSPGPSREAPATPLVCYDSTNGTTSAGSIVTFSRF